MSEFNLSSKKRSLENTAHTRCAEAFWIEDVREFIKLLKDDCYKFLDGDDIYVARNWIDKLAGPKLISPQIKQSLKSGAETAPAPEGVDVCEISLMESTTNNDLKYYKGFKPKKRVKNRESYIYEKPKEVDDG